MQNKIVTAIAIIVGLAVGGVMLWIWNISESSNAARAGLSSSSASTSGNTLSPQNHIDNSPLALGVSSGDALSDSSLTGGNRSGTAMQGQDLSTSASPNSHQSTNSAPGNSSNGDDTATTDPAKFSVYDKYKDRQSGLFAELAAGSGAEVAAGKKVSVNYRGWLTNGQPFDQNMDSIKPFSFTLGAHNVILGWEQTIAGMKVGSERLLIIPPAVGYGPTGQGPIPGNAVLVFYVKLLAVE